MQVKEIDIDTGKIKGYGICKKKYEILFLDGPTTPTYSNTLFSYYHTLKLLKNFWVHYLSKNMFCYVSTNILKQVKEIDIDTGKI